MHTRDKLKEIQGRLRRVLSSACESNCEDFVFKLVKETRLYFKCKGKE